jgi:hypothetical protein
VAIKDSCTDNSQNNALKVNGIYNNPAWSKQLDSLFNYITQHPEAPEAGTSLMKDLQYRPAKYSSHGITYGQDSSVNIPFYHCPGNVCSDVAKVHVQPNKGLSPPSGGDLYTLLHENMEYPMLKDSYEISYDSSQWVLHIEDPTKVSTFLENFPESENRKLSTQSIIGYALYEAFHDFRDFQHMDDNTAYAFAMAYILRAFDTGVKLLKRDESGNFKELNTYRRVTAAPYNIFIATECKK